MHVYSFLNYLNVYVVSKSAIVNALYVQLYTYTRRIHMDETIHYGHIYLPVLCIFNSEIKIFYIICVSRVSRCLFFLLSIALYHSLPLALVEKKTEHKYRKYGRVDIRWNNKEFYPYLENIWKCFRGIYVSSLQIDALV